MAVHGLRVACDQGRSGADDRKDKAREEAKRREKLKSKLREQTTRARKEADQSADKAPRAEPAAASKGGQPLEEAGERLVESLTRERIRPLFDKLDADESGQLEPDELRWPISKVLAARIEEGSGGGDKGTCLR